MHFGAIFISIDILFVGKMGKIDVEFFFWDAIFETIHLWASLLG